MQQLLVLSLALALEAGTQFAGATPPPAPRAPAGPGPESLPQLAWSDFNGDGRADLLVVHGGTCALLRAGEGGGLVDVTALVGLAGAPATSVAGWFDYDADGDPDLFLMGPEGTGALLGNDGGAFLDVSSASGLALEGPILRAEWGVVGDGPELDLVLWTPTAVVIHENRGDGTFGRQELRLESVVGASGGVWTEPGGESLPEVLRAGAGGRANARSGAGTGGAGTLGVLSSTNLGTVTHRNPEVTDGPFASAPFCAPTLRDATLGGCLQASAVPTLGMLHPLSVNLNVDPATGFVGVGTETPVRQFHVLSSGATTAMRIDSDGRALMLEATGSTSPVLDVRSGGGTAAFHDGQLEVGYIHSSFPGLRVPRVFLDTSSNAGRLLIQQSNSRETVSLVAEESAGNGAQLSLALDDGTDTIVLDAELGTGGAAELSMRMRNGLETVEIKSEEVPGDGAQIILRKADGSVGIVLDAEQGTNARITTDTLEITGGADLVESFDTGGNVHAPGTVLVIDPQRPGELTTSTSTYDRRVAGVVSGAGALRPGLQLGQSGVASGSTQVALTGRVYVTCSTENGPVQPGDLLTTSSKAGCAMRATDQMRSNGAVLGKAMTALEGGTALVLVLVNLQ